MRLPAISVVVRAPRVKFVGLHAVVIGVSTRVATCLPLHSDPSRHRHGVLRGHASAGGPNVDRSGLHFAGHSYDLQLASGVFIWIWS